MKRFWSLAAILLMISVLAACSEDVPEAEVFQVKHNGQTLTVIPVYDEILDYTAVAKNKTSKEKEELYREKVIKPFQEIAEEKDIDIGSSYFGYFNGDTDIEKLEANTIELLKKQDEIQELVEDGFVKSAEVLPGGDKALVLMPVDPEFTFVKDKMEGSTGVAFTEEFMLVQIDPSYEKDAISNSVAHEYFHVVDMEDGALGRSTVLDSILMEGKAESFARIIYPEKINPWSVALTDIEKEKVMNELNGNLDSYDYQIYQTLFSGDPSKGIPLWSNYKLGFEMVQDYLTAHPELTPEELVLTDSEEILESYSAE
jgi:uncharacterized protein YjaZ